MYPSQSWILDSTLWIPNSRYWIPVEVCGNWIPDSNLWWDFGFLQLYTFRIPDSTNRGNYMAARRFEISRRVLKKYFKYFSTLEEKGRISKLPCNVLFII